MPMTARRLIARIGWGLLGVALSKSGGAGARVAGVFGDLNEVLMKLITMLIYLNGDWDEDGGQLRLLRSATDIEDYAATVPPSAGTMLAFRCTDDAWHGHKPYEGERRSMQLNWVSGRGYLWKEAFRHNLSAMIKKFRRPPA